MGRTVHGWKIVAKVRRAKMGKRNAPIYRGVCPVCGRPKDQTLSYFRIAKSCGCRHRVRKPTTTPVNKDAVSTCRPAKAQRKQGRRKPGILVKYADLPTKQQIMLAECLGPVCNVMQEIAGDRFLLLLDAFQGDDVMIPTVERIEKRIIMAKIASEFKELKSKRGYSDQYIEPILEEMAKKHHTSIDNVREILRLTSIELRNARSEHVFTMRG